jgi:NADH-quinone oxidoreductase subunit I
MYCGICIEVCPFDALFWTPEFEYAELDIRDMTHEKGRLGEWMATVPAPPADDPHGARAKEVDAARKSADRAEATDAASTDAAKPDAAPSGGDEPAADT